jgi:OmpA-OmpF porin, OOP family
MKTIIQNLAFISALSLLGLGCGSSVKKADIPATANPSEEVARLQADIGVGYANHYDVLAEKDFIKANQYLEEAKKGLRNQRKQQRILDDIAYGRAYLQRAGETTDKRTPKAQGILDARRGAIDAGAKNYPQLKTRLKGLDDDLRADAKDLDDDLTPKEFARLQSGYQDLELAAIQSTQIGNARAMINGAKKDGASSNAPKSLKEAETSLKNAENMITTNRNNPEGYKEAVTQANRDAKLLVDVLNTTKRKGADLDEDAAIKMVKQNYEISRLNEEVGQAQSTIGTMDENLSQKNRQLSQAREAVGVQEAIEKARTEFTSDEAEVFQQGDKLLIRLKAMAFPSGRADLPSNSLALLSKVKTIAEQLNPAEIVVEGHTDSTGSPAKNRELSEKRAEAVAQYLHTSGLESTKIDSVGQGFKKPIATNKSPEGRQQNRRVDIVITPGSASSSMVR